MVNEFTLKGWLEGGYRLVEQGQADSVRIMGRRPTSIQDIHSPSGGYGWGYGWRWTVEDTVAGSSTLPEPIFRHLPACPYPEVVGLRAEGRGVMPRWPSEAEALAALDRGAWDWAVSLLPADRPEVTAELVTHLVGVWREATWHLSNFLTIVDHPTTRPIVALGVAAIPHIMKLANRHRELYRLIQEIEDQA